MEFKLTIGATPELLAAINLLAGAMPKPEVKPEPKAEPKSDKKATPKTETKPEAKPQPKAEDNGIDEPITLEAIRKRTGPLTQAGKKDHLKRALSFYGVEKLTDLPEENYAAFCMNLDEIEAGTPLINPNEI